MPDRDKVVKALEICTTRETCRYCPYNKESCCYEALERDALELLKAMPEPPKEGLE